MELSGKTIQELSKETGISSKTIVKYRENQIKIIYFKTLDKLCKNLNCNNTDLFH